MKCWYTFQVKSTDFLIQHENTIIPIEVKSGTSVTGKSLVFYNKEFRPKIRIRYSLKNLKQDEGLLNIPLFMVDYTRKIIDSVKELSNI